MDLPMNKMALLEMIATIRESLPESNKMFEKLSTHLLSYFDEPTQPCELHVAMKTASGKSCVGEPLKIGVSAKHAEHIEIAYLQTIIGSGAVPICVVSSGRWNAPGGPMTFLRAYDQHNMFFAEWCGGVENARPIFSPTPLRFSQWFTAEHETTLN